MWWLDLRPLATNASTDAAVRNDSTDIANAAFIPPLNMSLVPTVALQWTQMRQPSVAPGANSGTVQALTSACSWPPARNTARMAMLHGHVVLTGGLQSEPSPDVALRDTWVYKPSAAQWARYANLPTGGLSVPQAMDNAPPTRFAHSLSTVEGALFRLAPSPSPPSRVLRGGSLPEMRGTHFAPQTDKRSHSRHLQGSPSAVPASSLAMFGGRYITSSGIPVRGDTWVFDLLHTSNANYKYSASYSPTAEGWAQAASVGPGEPVGPVTPWGAEQLAACAALASPPLDPSSVPSTATPAGAGPPQASTGWPLGRWRQLQVPGVQFQRSYHAAAVWNASLFLFGGFALVPQREFTVGAVFGDTLVLPGATNSVDAPLGGMTDPPSPGLALGWQKLQPQALGNLAGVSNPGAANVPSERFETQGVFLPGTLGSFVNVTDTSFGVQGGSVDVPSFVIYGGAFEASKGDVWAIPARNASWRAVRSSDFTIDDNGITILDSTVFMVVLFSVVGLCFLGLALALYRRHRQRQEMLAMLEDLVQQAGTRFPSDEEGGAGGARRQPGVRPELLAELPDVTWHKGVPPPKVPLPAAGAANVVPVGRGYLVAPPREGWAPPMGDQSACSVCLEDFAETAQAPSGGSRDGDTAVLLTALPCGHAFHRPCIERWLGNHDDCPLCKSDVAKGIRGGSSSDSDGASGDESTDEERSRPNAPRRSQPARGGGGAGRGRGGGRPARRSLQGVVRTVQVNPAASETDGVP